MAKYCYDIFILKKVKSYGFTQDNTFKIKNIF